MEKWLEEEVGRTRYSIGTASMGAAGRAEVGRGRREKQDEVKKTREGGREEGKMAGKMSVGSRIEVAKPGREMELPWVSRQQEGASAWMGGRQKERQRIRSAQARPEQLGRTGRKAGLEEKQFGLTCSLGGRKA